MGAFAFEIDAILVVDLGRTVETDADVHFIGLEYFRPLLVDQDGIGADPALDPAARAIFDALQLFQQLDKPMFRKQQRLAAMEHQIEPIELELRDVLLEPLAKRALGFRREHRRLPVDLGIAKPITIRAIDVAAGSELDQNERTYGNVVPKRDCGFRLSAFPLSFAAPREVS